MASAPTQRTRAECKRLGYQSAIVERWNPHAKVRQDLFQFIDVLALGDGQTFAIQTCSGEGGAPAARRAKIEALPTLAEVIRSGWSVEVWSWAKRGARGKRKLWTLKRERYLGPNSWIDVDFEIRDSLVPAGAPINPHPEQDA
jgi:hypothetical protein